MNTAGPQQPKTYHFVITAQTAYGAHGTFDSTVTVQDPGKTRTDIFRQIRSMAEDEMGTDQITVLFFSLEPNQL